MPEYTVKVGTSEYDVTAPDENTAWQWANSVHAQTAVAAPTKAVEAEGSLLDKPIDVAKGITYGVRGITDIFGAENVASKGLRDLEGYLSGLQSAAGKQDSEAIAKIFKDAEDKGLGAQLGAAWEAFKVAPGSAIAQGIGTAIPTVAGGLAGAGTRLGVRGTGALLGAAMGTGVVKGSVYDAVNQQLLEAGATEEQAAKAASQAQSYTGDNLDMLLTGGFIGAITGGTGIEPAIAKAVSGNITKSLIGRVATGAVAEAVPEAVQGSQEQLAKNLALQRAGFDVPTMRGVVGAGAYEGLLGGVLGGGVGAAEPLLDRSKKVAEKTKTEEGFGEGETPPPSPPAAPQVGAEFDPETATEDELRGKLTPDPVAIEEFDRYRDMGRSAPVAFDAAYRRSIERNAAPKPGTEAPSGPTTTDTGEVGEPRVRGPKLGVPPVGGETTAAEPAAATTGATGAGLGVPSGTAQQVGSGEAGKPGTLDDDNTIGMREEARIKADEDAERLENELRSLSGPVEGETDEEYQNRIWEEEQKYREQQAKSEVGAGPSLFDVAPQGEGEAAPAMQREKFMPPGTAGLPLFTEERNVAGVTPLRSDETLQPTESRLIKAGTPEAETILRRQRTAKTEGKAEDIAAERMSNVTDYLENWVGRNPSFAPIRDAVKPYLRSAARAVVEDNVEPTDALLAAIPQKYKVQRAAVKNQFPRGTADEIIPSVPRVPQTMRRPQEVVLDRKLAEAIRFINAYVKSVNAPEIQKEWETELEKAGIDFTKSEDITQGSLLPKDTVASFLSRIKEYERVKGVKPPAPKAKTEEAPKQDEGETDDQYKRRLAGKTDFFEPPESTAPERDKTEEYIKNRKAAILGPKETTEETAAPLTDMQRKYGEDVAKNYDGTVVYQSGDMGLVRAYHVLTGQPVYLPFKGPSYINQDVDGNVSALFSSREKAELAAAKERLEAQEAEKHAKTPFVTFDKDGLAVSKDVNKGIAGVLSLWKKLLLPNVKLYITTEEDVRKNKDNFTGNLRAIGSSLLKKDTQGSTRSVGDNTYYIVFKKSTKPTLVFETIAHEMGHIHELQVFLRAPKAVQESLRNAHRDWLSNQKGKTAKGLIEALRGRTMGRRVGGTEGLTAAQLEDYWKSFSEWYADQTARWAVSDAKPVSVIEKFFARLGKTLRNFYNTLRGKGYLPNETFAQYMNNVTAGTDIFTPHTIALADAESAGTLFEAKSKAGKAEKEISRGQAKYQQSKNAEEQVSGLGLVIKNHDYDAVKEAVSDILYSGGQKTTKVLTNLLPTSSLLFNMGLIETQARSAGKDVIDAADTAADAEANFNAGLFNIVKPVVKFIKNHGYAVLANMQSTARLNKVSVAAFPDVASALAGDQVMQGYDKLIAGTTNPSEIADYTAGRNRRAAEITEAYELWNELGKLPGGHEAYKILRQFYQDAYNLRRAARDKFFDTLAAGDPATRAKLEQLRIDHFEKIKTAPDPNYHNINRSLTPEEYSPFMRFGDYWLRVTKGANGEPEYYHFEDTTTRRRFLQRRASELGVSSDDAEMFSTGKLDTEQGRAEFLSSDAALREMFNTIDKILPGDDNAVLRQSLKDDAYQARLDALPESDLRQHFKRAKERTGWAPDPLRVFKAYAKSFVNDIVKLEHKPKFDAAVSKAKDLIKSLPPGEDKDKLEEYMAAVIRQGYSAFSLPDTNALVTFMNRAGFLYFLSGGASAMANFVSVPGRAVPAIGAMYGYNKAAALFGKYTKVGWGGRGITTTLPDGTKEWSYPSLDKSPEIKNNPRLLKAFKALEEMRAFSLTPTAAIVGLEDTPSSALDAVDHKTKTALLQTSTALFNGAEIISRQIAAMMRYEAAYDARIEKGMDPKQADKEAVREATDETERALGNYRETERPAIMKGPIGRMVFQFKMYSVNTTRFFLENAYLMLRDKDPEVRSRAMKELAGVVAIGGMFSGLTGMFGYSVITTAIGMLLSQFEDDEDKRRRIEEDPVFADDYDGYFRYRWLPEHFGKVGAAILEVGPLAALTPLNLASRTSYNDLWFREGLTGSTWSESAKNLILANIGPAVTLGGSLDLAAKDFNDGEVMRGIERMMPALARGPLMSYRLGTEGAETRGGDKIITPEEIGNMQLVGAVLGLSPRQLAEYQKKRIASLNFQAKLKGDKATALRAVNKAMYAGDYDAAAQAMKKVEEFNSKYPSLFAIDDDTLDKSYAAYEEVRNKTVRGVKIEDDELAYYDFLIDGGT